MQISEGFYEMHTQLQAKGKEWGPEADAKTELVDLGALMGYQVWFDGAMVRAIKSDVEFCVTGAYHDLMQNIGDVKEYLLGKLEEVRSA